MTTHIHTVSKTAKATTEKLPDIGGTNIQYAGAVDCTVDIMHRENAEPTVTAGSTATVGGYTGVIDSQKADAKPALKLDDAVVWEVATTLMMEGDSV
jgi:urease alpha subunit